MTANDLYISVSRNDNANPSALTWTVKIGDGLFQYADTHYGAERLVDAGLEALGFDPDRLYELCQDDEAKPAHVSQDRWDLVVRELQNDLDSEAIWESIKWIIPELQEDQDGGEEIRVGAIIAEAVEINEDMALSEVDEILSRYGWTRDGLTPIRPELLAA